MYRLPGAAAGSPFSVSDPAMKITAVDTTPLLLPFKAPYHWARGVDHGATVVLVEVHTDGGVTGYGESLPWQSVETVTRVYQTVADLIIGRDPHDVAAIMRSLQTAAGTSNPSPRFFRQVFAGLEMALWDVAGKAVSLPVHKLFGGAVHDRVQYFAFLQGDTEDELRAHASQLVSDGYEVFYLKIGRGDEVDLRSTAAVREVIGSRRLRLDANEAWDPLTAVRMIRKLLPFEPEFIEQPTPSHSIGALAQVKASVDVAIAADQSVFTEAEVYEICRRRAADLIVLGIHETGGLLNYRKAAAVAEAAGINLCLHGVYESGITTCAANQVIATVPNSDDGHQIMWQLLQQDLVAAPDLVPVDGRLPIIDGPGLGFTLDPEAVDKARQAYFDTRKGDSV